jgi:uncharacterized protein
VTVALPPERRAEIVAALRVAGARFGFLHGSRAAGTHRPDSDVDVAAWWGGHAPPAFEVDVPAGVDLLVLDGAPLLLAGRVAMDGVLLFDDEPPARVRWTAMTRKIFVDELPRRQRADDDFRRSVLDGG